MKKICIFAVVFLLVTVMMSSMALADSAGTVRVSSGTLNVRSAPSTSSSITASLKKGSHVTLISRSGSWWYAEYSQGKFGYLHASYITDGGGKEMTVKLTSGTLNVRSGAGTSYARTDSLKNGEEVIVISSSGAWSYVLYRGNKTGYVSSKYLTKTDSSYDAVRLSVPSYKQADSRWANVTLGSSGKLMRYVGCATTGIAMMESYRTGKTVYPDAMSKQLRYTSSGNVYWPSNFVAVTSKTGYLDAIYDKLASGKPILFGAKTSSGKQHWVVITGYTGGELSASGFLINDPGSKTRETLAQFLAQYPVFYKYFYYK